MHGLTVIAFLGSVFSPYYAWARRRPPADPLEHCALNVALYSPRAARWTMTERGAAQVHRSASQLCLGRSSLQWNGACMDIAVDEICAPLPRRLRGHLRLHALATVDRRFELDAAARHFWQPLAPCARVEVDLTEPRLRWSGDAYLDSNFGVEPVENAFEKWTWSRASAAGETLVLYDVTARRDPQRSLALRCRRTGAVEHVEPPPVAALPRTGWGIARETRADAGTPVRLIKTLENAPFYSRSLLHAQVLGRALPAMHEALDLRRFRSAWVRALLPFRMPRTLFR